MKSSPILLALTAASLTQACMEFNGTLPFSHTAPFEASITDNGMVTCWISTSLVEHDTMQDALFSHQHSHSGSGIRKRSNGRKIKLTDMPAYDPSASSSSSKSPYQSLPASSWEEGSSPIDEKHVDLKHPPPPHSGVLPKVPKMEELEWEDIPVWQPWNFECISGHKAKANVGMRGFSYQAHGQDFHFVPKMKEDLWGERWVYSLRLWCGEKDKQGKVVERPKAKGAAGGQAGQGEKEEAKKPATAAAAGASASASASAGSAVKQQDGNPQSNTNGASVVKSGLKNRSLGARQLNPVFL